MPSPSISAARRARERSSSGRITLILEMRVQPRWAGAASSMSASSYARNMARCRAGRVHDASRTVTPLPIGERRQSASACAGTSDSYETMFHSGAADPLPPYLARGRQLGAGMRNSRLSGRSE